MWLIEIGVVVSDPTRDVGEEEEKEIQETIVKNKLSWQNWQYIYKNGNYLHKINGGSTAENVICHSEKHSFPTREEDNSVFGWNKSTESTWKHYFFGLFPQISTLFTFPNPLPPDREAEGITAFSECSLKLSGASLWMHHEVWRVIAHIWNLLGLFHPKLQERLPLVHEPLDWIIQIFSEDLRCIM